MRQFLNTLEDEKTNRGIEEYLGAFTESIKMIQYENPVERIGHAALLAAKTALRLKAANSKLKEHEIATLLQTVARNVRLASIINDLTPEEKHLLNYYSKNQEKDLTNGVLRELARKSKISLTFSKSKSKSKTTSRKRD